MPNLFTREDTMLGICEGLGQEIGLPSNLFRVAFALGLFWNPVAIILAYLTLGAALGAFRWASPVPAAAASAPPVATPDAGTQRVAFQSRSRREGVTAAILSRIGRGRPCGGVLWRG